MGGLYSLCQQDHAVQGGSRGKSQSQTNANTAPVINSTTERPSVAQKLIDNGVVPDVLGRACEQFASIQYPDVGVKLGAAVLTPTQTKDLPTVAWTGSSKLYAVFMTDPDAISRDNPLFREFVHFAALNVKATVISPDSCGDVALQYAGPAPPYNSGKHRYVWLVYAQQGQMETGPLSEYLKDRGGKQVDKWAQENKLELVAANVFEAKWDEHCDQAHTDLGFLPPVKYQSPSQQSAAAELEKEEIVEAEEEVEAVEENVETSVPAPVQEEAELKALEEKDLVNPETQAATAEMLADKIQTQAVDNKMKADEKEELKELEAKDLVNPDTQAAVSDMLADKIEKQAFDNKMEAEEKAELDALAEKDLVNPETQAEVADLVAEKIEKQAFENKIAAEEKEELNELESKDLVNPDTQAAVADMVAEKIEKQAFENKMEAEEKEELNELESKDLVNPDTQAAMADMVAEKIEKQAFENKMEAEEKKEIDDLAAEDLVNEETKDAMADMLKDKLEKQAVDNKMEAEEKAELDELAGKDLVNPETQAAMEEMLVQKKELNPDAPVFVPADPAPVVQEEEVEGK